MRALTSLLLGLSLASFVTAATWHVPCLGQICSYQALVNISQYVQSGDTVNVDAGTFLGPCGVDGGKNASAVFIGDDITLTGAQTIITCNNLGVGLYIFGDGASVSGFVFNATESGAFEGAITFSGLNQRVAGCSFTNTYGYGIYYANTQGAAVLTVVDSVFTHGTAFISGAALSVQGNLTMINSEVSYMYSLFDIPGAMPPAAIVDVDGYATVTGCTFLANSGVQYGLSLYASGGVVTDSTFQGIVSNSSAAVFFLGSATLTGCTFYGNSGTSLMVSARSNSLSVSNCSFINNHGASAVSLRNSIGDFFVTFEDTLFSNNTTPEQGGAIQTAGNRVLIAVTRCTFEFNHATGDGGAVFNDGRWYLTVTNSTFVGNSALGMGSQGGAIWGLLVLYGDVMFLYNAAANGGAIYASVIYATQNDNQTTSVTFIGNSAQLGGAILLSGIMGLPSNITAPMTFINNTAYTGGALFATRCFTLSGATFSGNTAMGSGGGIYFLIALAYEYNGTSTLVGCSFSDNMAANGGAFLVGVDNGGTVEVLSCLFSGNNATEGGAADIALYSGNVALTDAAPNTFTPAPAATTFAFLCTDGQLLIDGDSGVYGGLPLTASPNGGVDCSLCGCCYSPTKTGAIRGGISGCFFYPGQICNVTCGEGGTLNATTPFGCVAPGQWTMPPADVCLGVPPETCPTPSIADLPAHAVYSQCPNDAPIGTPCILGCAPGFEAVQGSVVVGNCRASTGQYEGQSIVCAEVSTSSTTVDNLNPFAPPPDAPSPSSHAGAIAGGVVGGLVVLGLIGAVVVYYQRKRATSQAERERLMSVPLGRGQRA